MLPDHKHQPAPQQAHDTALLIVDMINHLEWPDGELMLPQAMSIVPALLQLKRRISAEGGVIIYCNDHFGQWRSDFRGIVEHCSSSAVRGMKLSQAMHPDEKDYFILKPKHSAFYATALDWLLSDLKIKRLVVCGIAGDGCVLSTATDAHIRGFPVWVPCDTMASMTDNRQLLATAYLSESLGLDTRQSCT